MEEKDLDLAFPLQWPQGSTRSTKKKRSPFRITPGAARDLLEAEVRKLAGPNHRLVISTDIPVRKSDGMPFASYKEPTDTGVAIYFMYDKEQVCLCCDQYERVYENICALAKGIGAMRGLDRWGISDVLKRAFTGFKALPQDTATSWWNVLECSPDTTYEVAKAIWQRRTREFHPDNVATGNMEKFHALQAAWAQAKAHFNRNEK